MSNLNVTAGAWTPPASGASPSNAPFDSGDSLPSNTGTPADDVSATSVSANLSEKEEAAAIVAKAKQDQEDRKKDAAKVAGGGMSKEELQALINSKSKR